MTSLLDKIVSYGPKTKVLTKDEAKRSVVVQNIPPNAAADSIVIHFQRQKNGGGEIDHVHIPEKGTAVITFESSEVAGRVLEHSQTLEGSELKLDRFIPEESPEVFQQVKARVSFDKFHIPPQEYQKFLEILKENEVVCRKGSKNFILSGKFSQIEYANKLLQYLIKLKGENEAIHHGGDTDQTHRGSSSDQDELGSEPSAIAESSSFEIQPQFMKLLKQVYEGDLQKIEEKFAVKIVCDENASEVCVSSKKMSKGQNRFQEGCEAFIDLYQKFHPKIRREVVELPNEASERHIRQAISFVETNNPAIVEKVENSLVVYAEKDGISSSVHALKQTLGLREDSSSKKTRRGQGNENRDAREYFKTQTPGFNLPHRLDQVLKNGVVLSLYQGDITDERVDAIVNAANENLQHGAGVAGAIVRKGGHQIQDESNRLTKKYGPLHVGKAAYTRAGYLPCRYVIHAVGPRWEVHGKEQSILLLRQACVQSLRLAVRLELSSIALTAISSGIFGMPKHICAQVMFEAVEAFSASDDAEFSTLRDVRIVIIDDPTISVFQEEFVKRYLSKEASQRTVTNQRRPSHEETEASPANKKQDPQISSGANSVDSLGRKQTEDNKSFDAKSEQDDELESPREQTAQDEDNDDQRDVSESIKERPLSNQGTENTNRAILFSAKSPETEQEGVDSKTKDDNSAPVENSYKDNKRMPSRPPSGRGRGNLAPTFPGKGRSTPNGSLGKDKNVDAVRGRGVTSNTVTTMSSPPGLTVTEEGKIFARHIENHENDKQTNGEESVEYKKETEVVEFKTTSLQKGKQSRESESQKQNQSQIKATDESEETTATEQRTLPEPNSKQENTSENPFPPREKITDLDKSLEGSEADDGTKLSTIEKTKNARPRRDQCKNQHSNIYEDVKGVPHPDADAENDGRMTSHDPLVSQTASGQMEAVIKASVEGESITRGPHPSSDLQASPQGVNKVDEDVEGDSKDAQSRRSREVSETDPVTRKDTYNNGHMREPRCLMCINLNKDPIYPSKCGRGHFYCESCIKYLLEKAQICPQCEKEGLPRGNQPIGCMSWTTQTQRSLPGYQDCEIIVVCFSFEKGIQGAQHPNPGKPYSALVFIAFLPCNTEGQELCFLLKMAFEAGLLFTIGTSPATGEENVIVCNGIELKTSQSGGPANYGYPDPSYLDRVKSQLAEKGITQLHPSAMSTGDYSYV